MLEIDFLAVESADGAGSKSGDAIVMRFTTASWQATPFVVVIDGGYGAVGERVVSHIRDRYLTDRVDLVVSTHPDADHINGLVPVLENLHVEELLLHLPWNHHSDVSDFSNIEKIEELYALAQTNEVGVVEPFTGVTRFGDAFRILGPTTEYYEQLLEDDLPSGVVDRVLKASAEGFASLSARSEESEEPLDDTDRTSARNNSSVVCSLFAGGEYHIFTGDAGITALDAAGGSFSSQLGVSRPSQIEFFQVPHHGSRRNLGPGVLDLWFPYGAAESTAFISSAKVDEKHPGLATLRELNDRGFRVHSTEGRNLLHSHDASPRADYYEAPRT
jgi:beta-lactamase superfamily II metal-dependent hydrolase